MHIADRSWPKFHKIEVLTSDRVTLVIGAGRSSPMRFSAPALTVCEERICRPSSKPIERGTEFFETKKKKERKEKKGTSCLSLWVNRQLAKLLSGFVTGQITVAKVVVTVAAQSLAWGKWLAATLELSLSFRSCSCLSGCLWISL